MIFQLENLSSCWGEVWGLAMKCMTEKGLIYHPDYQRYKEYEQCDNLYIVTVRTREREMVGFAMMYVFRSMHTQMLGAQEDLFYLLPDYRKGWTALRLLREVEDEARRRGCSEVSMVTEIGSVAGAILDAKGYAITSRNHRKILRADSPVSTIGKAVA
mgnify:FL=1